MPVFEVQSPDGKTYEIEGANAEGALAALRKHLGDTKQEDRGVMGRAHDEGMADLGATARKAAQDFNPYADEPATGAWDALKKTISSQLETPGKVLNATMGMLGAYPTGAGSSLIGRELLAPGLKMAGELLNPDVANKQTSEDIYQEIKPDVGLALSAMRARGAVKPNVAGSRDAGDAGYKLLTARGNTIPMSHNQYNVLADGMASDLHIANLRRANVPNAWKWVDEIDRAGGNPKPDINDLIGIKQKIREESWGIGGKEGEAHRRIMKHIDDQIRVVDPVAFSDLKKADFEWAKFKQGERVQEAIQEAKDRARSSGVGGNLYNTTKQELRKIKDSPEGLTEAELNVAKRVSGGPVTRNILHLIGKLDPTSGAIPLLAHTTAAAPLGGMNIPAAAAGFVARHLSQRLALKDANRLAELIQARTPETMRLSGPMQEWAVVAEKFKADPTAKNFARLTIASRNFSHNLKDFGVDISPNELLRSLQGTSPARSDEDE